MDVFDLSAKITLDSTQYEEGLSRVEAGTGSFGSRLGGVLKKGAIAFAAVGAAATAAAVKIGKSALDAYADYEQLEGGVQKLYGSAADQVMQYASQAYKTAGMSANQYMEQATSFSAALVNSLGGDTKKAAEQTDVAMRAISDNFNTFGGDISMIQGAFQGFAKQNYTMLDNLKLGYGGTKEEMERLISDANEYAKANGMAADLSIDSFSDIVTAIDLVQQKQNIAGTTAKEASTTIAGSVGQVKAAWENLLAGFANPDADISQLVSNFVDSISVAAENIMPAVEQIVKGLSEALTTLVPQIMEIGSNIIMALLEGIIEYAPKLAEQAMNIITTLALEILNHLPQIVEAGIQVILALINGLIKAIPKLAEQLPKIITAIIKTIIDNLPKIIEAGVKLVVALAKGLIKAIPKLIAMAPKLISALFNAIIQIGSKLISAGVSLVKNIITGIGNWASNLLQKGKNLISDLWNAVKGAVSKFVDIGANIVKGIWNGIKSFAKWIKNKIKEWVGNVVDFIKDLFGVESPSKVMRDEVGIYLAQGLALGILDGKKDVEDAFNELMPSEIDTSYTTGGLQTALEMSISGAVTDALGGLAPILEDGMANALEGVKVKLNQRNFGKLTREAVNGTI